MKILIAAVSAIALAATPALAQGNGNGNGGGNSAKSERGNGGNGNRGGGGNRGAGNDNRGGGNAVRADNRGDGNPNRGGPGARSDNRGNGNGNRGGPDVRVGNRGGGAVYVDDRGNGNRGNRGGGNDYRRGDRDGIDIRIGSRDGGLIERVLYRDAGFLDGCPPGLAKKRNGCLPPGQAKKLDPRYDRYSRYGADWWGLPYGRGNYFYEDGFLLRHDGGRISGYIPLLGGALTIGNPWPRDYGYRRVPDYYSSYYGLGNSYRYADNVVYRLDPETAAITSIAAMLTGDEIVVGRPMPRGYDVYNVPYSYRDRYYDRPGAHYRYSDGYVYEIDPETMLVASAIELLI